MVDLDRASFQLLRAAEMSEPGQGQRTTPRAGMWRNMCQQVHVHELFCFSESLEVFLYP